MKASPRCGAEAPLSSGLTRTIDTWAQRPDTGEQGMHSVSYSRE